MVVVLRVPSIVAVSVGMTMKVRVPVSVGVTAGSSDISTQEQKHSEAGDNQPGDRTEPRIKLLRHDVTRCVQRDRSEKVDARRVGGGHNQTQQASVRRGPSRPHQIGGHNRLSVAGLESV